MKKPVKISKGYRLSPQTHRKISKIKKIMNTDSDKAIFSACVYYFEYVLKLNNKLK